MSRCFQSTPTCITASRAAISPAAEWPVSRQDGIGSGGAESAGDGTPGTGAACHVTPILIPGHTVTMADPPAASAAGATVSVTVTDSPSWRSPCLTSALTAPPATTCHEHGPPLQVMLNWPVPEDASTLVVSTVSVPVAGACDPGS